MITVPEPEGFMPTSTKALALALVPLVRRSVSVRVGERVWFRACPMLAAWVGCCMDAFRLGLSGAALVVAVVLVGCASPALPPGGDGGDDVSVTVSLVPAEASLEPRESVTFTATVTGATDTSLVWSATCGSLSGSGSTRTYTAPASAGSCVVRATSAADDGVWDEATVTIAWRAATVTVAAGVFGIELTLAQAAAARYMEANPGVVVEVLDAADLGADRLGYYLSVFEAESPELDVLQIDVIWPGDLEEHFVDLFEFGAGDVVDQHFPALVENNTVDGRLIAIPWFSDAGLLYFRTDLLERYGFDGPPATWTELTDMAQVIQDGERAEGNADFWGFVWQGNASESLTCNALEWIASNAGGSVIEPDGVITVYNPNAVEIIELAASWVGTISPPGVTGFAEEDARLMFQAGNAAFQRNWPYAYALGQGEDSDIAGLFDVSPLPAGDAEGGRPAAALGGWHLGVSRYSENPALAADVALFLASYEEQKSRAIVGGFIPTVMDLYEDTEVLDAVPFFGALFDVFINAVARPSTVTAPNYAEVSALFFRAVHDVLTGAEDADTAMALLEGELAAFTGFPAGAP